MYPPKSMYYPSHSQHKHRLRIMPLRDRTGFQRPLYEFNSQRLAMPGHIHSYPGRAAIQPVMLYEDGLDYENCHNFSVNPERFYEDILTPSSMTSAEDIWKKMPLNIGLPTPPSTPEKSTHRMRNSKMLEPSIMSLNYNNNYNFNSQIQQSPNSNLQVVPDTITGEDVHDIIPFLTDLGNRNMASPNFFTDKNCIQGHASIQPKPSPPPCKPLESLSHSSSPYHSDHITICGFNDNDQGYQQQTHLYNDGKEGSYPVASYRDHMTDNRCSNMQASISNLREPVVPECMLSPVSPTKSLKRPYSAISVQSPPQRPQNVPSSSVARKLDFMDEYAPKPVTLNHNNVTVAQNIGSMSQNGAAIAHNGGNQQLAMRQNEQYLRQMAVSNLESYGQATEGETAGESELSRATHNVLERQRRNDLKMRFHMLRDNLPELMNNEKAPKIQILKKAYEFTQELKAQEQILLADKELERQRKYILLRRLNALRQGFF